MPTDSALQTLASLETQALNFVGVLGLLILIGICVAFVYWLIKHYWQARRLLTGRLLLITVPKWEEISDVKSQVPPAQASSARAEQMFSELHGLLKQGFTGLFTPQDVFSFEILATHENISFYVFCPKPLTEKIINLIQSNYPEADIQEVPDYNPFPSGGFVDSTRIGLKGPIYAPTRTFASFTVDPLNSLTNKMASLETGETLLIQMICSPAGDSWRRRGFLYLNRLQSNLNKNSESSTTTSGLPRSIEKKFASQEVILDQDLYQKVEQKIKKPAFSLILNCVSVAKTKSQATANLKNLVLSFAQFNLSPLSQFVQAATLDTTMINHIFSRTPHLWQVPWSYTKMVLNTEEVATLFHLPSSAVTTPRILWLKAKKAAAPTTIPKEGLHLGYN
ncbi:MAG: hypothetical protein HYS86_04750, partial [Candidatus Chisholmbacteria bacterium]|nr:hypothetical protein [Candidatus Chisholmbacteria bacterium]